MMSGLVVSARCSCPILVQLRWADVVRDLSSNPSVNVDVVLVAFDAANHANLDVDAIFSLVNGYVDGLATLHLVDVVVYLVVVVFLYDVVMQLSNVMLLDVGSSLQFFTHSLL